MLSRTASRRATISRRSPVGSTTLALGKPAIFITTSIIYATALYWMYPTFHYWVAFFAFRLTPHPVELALSSFLYVFVLALVGSLVKDGVFALFSTALLFTTFIPLVVILPYFNPEMAGKGVRELAVLAFTIFCCFGMLSPDRKYVGFHLSINEKSMQRILAAICVFNIIIIAISFRSVISLESFVDIYGQRARYRSVTGIASYFVHWQMLVLSPISIFYGVRYGKVSLSILGVAGALVVFLITSMKMALAVPALMFISTRYPNLFGRVSSKNFIAISLTLILVLVYLVDINLDKPLLTFYITDRNLYAHGVINLMILEDFSNMPSALWGGSFLKMFVDRVYVVDPFIMVGQSFFGTDVRANTNFFGDGYINLKAAGVVIMSVVSGITVFISVLVLNRHDRSIRILMLPVVMAFMNGPIQVTILTNGLFLFWLILLILPYSAERRN